MIFFFFFFFFQPCFFAVIPATTKIVHENPDMASAELVFDLMKGLQLDKDPLFAKYLGEEDQPNAKPDPPFAPPPTSSAPQQPFSQLGRSSSPGSGQSPSPALSQLSPYSRAERIRQVSGGVDLSSPAVLPPVVSQVQAVPAVSQPPANSQLRKLQEQATARQMEIQARAAKEKEERDREQRRKLQEQATARQMEIQARAAKEKEERDREQRLAAERQLEAARMMRDAELKSAMAAMEMELILEDEVPKPVAHVASSPVLDTAAGGGAGGAPEAAQKRSRKKFLQD